MTSITESQPLDTFDNTVHLQSSHHTVLIWDHSPLDPLESCTDVVTYTEHGKEIHCPRVLISRKAKAYWDEGLGFVFVRRSFSRCADMLSITRPYKVKAIFSSVTYLKSLRKRSVELPSGSQVI